MYNADTGALCATHDMVLVGIDAVTRKSAAMPDEMRERLSQKLVSVDRK
jgi:acyl-CoA thioesterase FadM